MTGQQPPAPGPKRELTLEHLQEFLGGFATLEDARLQPYLEGAAVLAAFDLRNLHPTARGKVSREEALDGLLALCEPAAQMPAPGMWALSLPARRATLEKMATRAKMRKALDANPARMDVPLQRMLDGVIVENLRTLDELSRDELAALIRVGDWLAGILDGLPDPARVRIALSRVDLLAPMQRLAGSGFVGRTSELRQLSEWVRGLPPPTPLFIFGTGGVGKSTLVARFLLLEVAPNDMPLAYLDIDRPTIRPDQPLTLLLDAIAQFRPQISWSADLADPIVKEITSLLGRQESGRHLESVPAYTSVLGLFARGFARQLQGRTALLVVDTIEEAQFLGPDVMWGLMEFLFELQRTVPQMRILLVGRALPEEYISKAFPGVARVARAGEEENWTIVLPAADRPMNLGVLDEPSARELLVRSLLDFGVPSLTKSETDDVVAIVSRNPMCLKLAARVLRDEGVDALRADRARFLAKLKAEKIQGLLYGRILRHVHGEDVRRVAYPGLVVRRITPEVIREVLAGPCKLDLTPQRDEHAIFNGLRNEAALVDVDPEDGSLRHRADVRRVMLQDLTDHVDQAVVSAIHDNAVRYYGDRTDAVSRAEEIYHRLWRRDPFGTLDSLWMPQAGPRLKTALDELPAQQRIWLAGKLSVTLDPSVRETADQEAWEGQAAQAADRYLRAGAPDQALAVLRERSTRAPRSQLYGLEAEAYRFLRQFDRALDVASRGVEAASKEGAVDLALELLLKMAAIEESRERLSEAEAFVDRATALAANTSNRMLQLRAAVSKLRVQRQLRPADRSERATLRRETLSVLDAEMYRRLKDQPVLLREVAAELGKQDSRIAALALETIGIEVETDAQATALGKAIDNLAPAQGKLNTKASADKVFIGTDQFRKSKFDPDVVRKWATETVTQRDVRRIGSALAGTEIGDKVLSGFRDYFRAGVTSALRGASKNKTSGKMRKL